MKKYSFLVYHREYSQFLEAVREQGLLHISMNIPGNQEDDQLQNQLQMKKRVTTALRFLQSRKIKEANGQSSFSGEEILQKTEVLQAEKNQLIQQQQNLEKEIQLLEPWGNFSNENIARLEDAGYYIHFFSVSSKRWEKEWMEHYQAFIISETSSITNFICITPSPVSPEIDAEAINLPEQSLETIQQQLNTNTDRLKRIETELDELAQNGMPQLDLLLKRIDQDLDFDRVILHTPYTANDKIAVLEGFIPENAVSDFENFLEKQSIYFESYYPDRQEKVPVLLKNNRFTRLFETIGDLYALPGYQELDLTPYYAPFYWLFFGFCLGDAGYGILLSLLGFIMASKAKPALKNPMRLLGMLGLATIFFGLLGGTFFGINLYDEHFWFYGPLADKMAAQGKTINDYLFSLALLLGGVQIIFGMGVKVVNQKIQFGWKNALSSLGWFILIAGGVIVYLLYASGVSSIIWKGVLYLVLIAGFAGAFIFNDPKRNVFINIGSGLWDAYNMATGLMGDLLSYIRLFALGISSAILGYVFNSLAVQLAPSIPIVRIIVMIIILIIGHGINLFMSTLGSFVHPMRLTFVEFYKNAGFAGGGIHYSPFSKKISE